MTPTGPSLARDRPHPSDDTEACAIADYAIIGDCRSAALVSTRGSIDWLCLPHFSGPSVFAAILDPDRGGRFAITPVGEFSTERRYLESTAVLETTFRTDSGVARLTDAMALGRSARNLEPMREVVRVLDCVEGTLALQIDFVPRPDYARTAGRLRSRGRDWIFTWRNQALVLRPDCPLQGRPGGAGARIEMQAGESLCFSLSYEDGEIAILPPLATAPERIRHAADWWKEWSDACEYQGRWRPFVVRSALTLKLLTYALSGAVVAAPTTSLPEWIGGDRNWDYRYCWLRDAALTMRAFIGLGLRREAAAFLRWLLHATVLTWPRLGVLYDVFGRTELPESEIDTLSGYRNSKPVRIGNAAHRQVQLDVYGAVITAAAEFVDDGGVLQADQRRLLAGFGRIVCKLWREPDHGIWEIRGAPRDYTFSKLMCWVALDRLLRIPDIPIARAAFERERTAIAEAIETRGYNAQIDSYVGTFGGDSMDAALLLMAPLGYGDRSRRRLATTFDRIEERLCRNGLFNRYEPYFDEMRSPEGTFGICSFWAVENLAFRGELDRAERLFESLVGRGNDLGLFSEEIDADTGELLGNFPQAFTHLGLINAALSIDWAQRREGS